MGKRAQEKSEKVIREAEAQIAVRIIRALLGQLFVPEGHLRPGLPEDVARTATIARRVMEQAGRMGRLLHFARTSQGASGLEDIGPETIEKFARFDPAEGEPERLKEELSSALAGLSLLSGQGSGPEKTEAGPKEMKPNLFLGPFTEAIRTLEAWEGFTEAEREAVAEFGRFAAERWRMGRMEDLGHAHFEEFLEERLWEEGGPEALEDLVGPLETFARVICRADALRAAEKRIAERTGDWLGYEMTRLFERVPTLAPYRGPIEEFLRHAQNRMRVRSLHEVSFKHFEAYVEALLERGASIREIEAAHVGLGAFSRTQGKWQAFVPLVHRLAGVTEIAEKGRCWIARAAPRAATNLPGAGFSLHRHASPLSGCAACDSGVPGGSWWTDEVLRVARLQNPTMPIATRRRLAQAAQSFRARSLALSEATEGTMNIPAPEGLEYLPFQKAGIEYALMRRRTLIADEMGLGKTIEALGVMNALPSLRKILVVAPATLLLNWKREAETWLVGARPVRILSGPETPSIEAGVYLASYSRLPGPLGQALRACEWDLVVADEAHYLKNPEADRSRAFYGEPGNPGLLERAQRALFLTGTPILNRAEELVTLISRLDPYLWGDLDLDDFEEALRRPQKGPNSFPSQLRQTLMIRREKVDVLTTLPPKRRMVVALERETAADAVAREGEVLRFHARAIGALRAELERTSSAPQDRSYERAVAGLREARRVALRDLGRVRHATALAKVDSVGTHVEDLLAEGLEKVVVWAHHQDVVEALADRFGIQAVRFHGGMNPTEKQASVDRFQKDKGFSVFVGSIHAAGTGHTLTAASHEVFAELDWTPGYLCQAEDRCHRIGQTKSVLIQHLVVDGSLDARMAKVLVEKQRLIRDLLEGEEARAADERAEEEALDVALGWAEEAA